MSDNTKIEWTDATWNPITGCSVVSAGCKHCYAMKLAGTRLQHHPSRAGLTVDTKAGPVWTGEVRFNEQWIDQPLRWSKPRMVFVCAHADLFHPSVPLEWVDKVFAVMALAKRHTFQVLTKRPERMREYLADLHPGSKRVLSIRTATAPFMALAGNPAWPIRFPLPNVWLGVSVEDQAAADDRIPMLLDTPAAVRWISAEPLLGPVDLNRILVNQERGFHGSALHEQHDDCYYQSNAQLDWVVVGGESGHGARPMQGDWVRKIRDQCAEAGVPYLFKQWGEWIDADQADNNATNKLWAGRTSFEMRDAGLVADIPKKPVGPPFFGCDHTIRLGKKAAGRLLDGVQHDGYPGAAQ